MKGAAQKKLVVQGGSADIMHGGAAQKKMAQKRSAYMKRTYIRARKRTYIRVRKRTYIRVRKAQEGS
jgi:hypothetical protein